MTKELVISYYKENLNWVKKIKDSKITIYNKSSLDIDNTISLPNVGREMQTYFHHIVENYDNLSDWVFFTQGNPFDHVKDYVEIVNDFPESLQQSKLSINDCHFFSNGNHYNDVLISNPDGMPLHKGLNVNRVWVQLFETAPPENYSFVGGCIFCITSEQIRKRSKNFYIKAREIAENEISSPWEYERMMYSLFDNNNIPHIY